MDDDPRSNVVGKRLTEQQIGDMLAAHAKWLRVETGGERADLSRAVLRGADLSGADLRGAVPPTSSTSRPRPAGVS